MLIGFDPRAVSRGGLFFVLKLVKMSAIWQQLDDSSGFENF